MGRKAAFHNLGCKVNEYETEAMIQELERAGYETVPFAPGADVYVINTCTVTNIADRKSRQMLHRAKEMNPSAAVVAVGCYAEDARGRLRADPAVDIIVGNNDKSNLAAILDAWYAERSGERAAEETIPYTDNINNVRTYEELEIDRTVGRTRAYIKIQDGCNQFCSYCMIPYVRGRVRSRRAEDVLAEAERLSRAGYQEIVLTGIHISSYGLDFDAPDENRQTPDASEAQTNERLLDLIRRICALDGVRRVRLGSLEPGVMTEEFVQGLAALPEICPQFHLSLQSGCDATLARMKRKYNAAEFRDRVTLLRRWFREPAITTDIITGFPGETDEEFAETVEFVKALHFAKTHVFKYSRRDGTRAAAMPEQLTDAVKHRRSLVLIDLDRQNRRAYAEQFRGKTVEVLFEERKEDADGSYMTGHTREALEARLRTEADASGEIREMTVWDVLPDGTLMV